MIRSLDLLVGPGERCQLSLGVVRMSRRRQTVSKSLMGFNVAHRPLAALPDLLTDMARLSIRRTS